MEADAPGLTVNAQGGWIQAVPSFSDRYDPNADVVDGLGNPIGSPLMEDVDSSRDPLVGEPATPSVVPPAAVPPTPPTTLRQPEPVEPPITAK